MRFTPTVTVPLANRAAAPAAILPAAIFVVAIFAVVVRADLVGLADPLVRDFFVTAMLILLYRVCPYWLMLIFGETTPLLPTRIANAVAIFPAAIFVVAILAVVVGADFVGFADPLIRDFFVTAMVLSPRMF
jgi:hypothetical protein